MTDCILLLPSDQTWDRLLPKELLLLTQSYTWLSCQCSSSTNRPSICPSRKCAQADLLICVSCGVESSYTRKLCHKDCAEEENRNFSNTILFSTIALVLVVAIGYLLLQTCWPFFQSQCQILRTGHLQTIVNTEYGTYGHYVFEHNQTCNMACKKLQCIPKQTNQSFHRWDQTCRSIDEEINIKRMNSILILFTIFFICNSIWIFVK